MHERLCYIPNPRFSETSVNFFLQTSNMKTPMMVMSWIHNMSLLDTDPILLQWWRSSVLLGAAVSCIARSGLVCSLVAATFRPETGCQYMPMVVKNCTSCIQLPGSVRVFSHGVKNGLLSSGPSWMEQEIPFLYRVSNEIPYK